jgi:glucan phosphoethanolaminetransferase (alkaline phosphatase superfamily)
VNDTPRKTRVDLGLISIWPLAWCILFYGVFGNVGMILAFPGSSVSPEMMAFGTILLLVHLATIVVVIALMVLYIREIVTRDWASRSGKALWIVLLVVGSVLTLPVYWYLYVWRERGHNPE